MLVDHFYEGDLLKAVKEATDILEGSYALGVICNKEPDRAYRHKERQPLDNRFGE